MEKGAKQQETGMFKGEEPCAGVAYDIYKTKI